MELEERVQEILQLLEEKKAKNIALFDLEKGGQPLTAILANFQTAQDNKAAAQLIMQKYQLPQPEGFGKGEWIVFDMETVVLHLFIPARREKYNLDKLWQGKKIAFKTKK